MCLNSKSCSRLIIPNDSNFNSKTTMNGFTVLNVCSMAGDRVNSALDMIMGTSD